MTLVPPVDSRLPTVRALAANGEWRDVGALLSTVVAHADLASELLVLRGEAHLRVGDTAGAHAWVTEALPVARARHDRIAERTLLNQLGVACFQLGFLGDAEEAFLGASAGARRDGDDLLMARASNNLGMIANVRGERDAATQRYQLAIPAYQRLGHARGLAETYHNLALTSREQGNVDLADEYERHAIEFAHQARDERLELMCEIGLADACLLRADPALAERRALRAGRRCRQLGDRMNEADALRALGTARLALGRLRAAGLALERAVELASEVGAAIVEAESLWERAKYHLAIDRPRLARTDAERAHALFERLRSPHAPRVRQWLAETALPDHY